MISKTIRGFRAHLVWLGALLLSSCASPESTGPKQSTEAYFNRTAGRGDSLIIKVQLEDGHELPFMLDTGAPVTVLDKSLEPELGKVLGTNVVRYGWLGDRTNHVFKAPKLYLGNLELHGARRIWTDDVTNRAHSVPPLMGILGMDYLGQYAVQLDFSQCKIRFLNPEQLKRNSMGKALQFSRKDGMIMPYENLLEVKGAKTIVDTADYDDGALDAKTFQRQLQPQRPGATTHEWTDSLCRHVRELNLSGITFRGQAYTNLVLRDCTFSSDPKMNVIGLRFLARHLVTFDFSKNRMYLKQNSVGALLDPEVKEGVDFLVSLKRNKRLPGFSNDDRGVMTKYFYETGFFAGTYPLSIRYDVKKQNDTSFYHYTIGRNAPNSSWILQRAWQTDSEGNTIEKFASELSKER